MCVWVLGRVGGVGMNFLLAFSRIVSMVLDAYAGGRELDRISAKEISIK